MVQVDSKGKKIGGRGKGASTAVVLVLVCIVALVHFSNQGGESSFLRLNAVTDGTSSKKTGCCIPCQTPKNKCCLTCEERSPDTERDVLMALMEGLTVHIDTKHLADHKWLETRAWEGLSHIGNRIQQATFYYDWARTKIPKTGKPTRVCEIGFNGGHSAGIFLASTPRTTNMTVFDLGYFKYSPTSLNFIQRVFPGRVEFRKGSSFKLVPEFTKERGRACDIFSVDGNHTAAGAQIDILNAIQATRVGGWIIMDDTSPNQEPRAALEAVYDEHPDLLSEKNCARVQDLVSYQDRYDTTHVRSLNPVFCWMQVLK